jgi:hypothetical protein
MFGLPFIKRALNRAWEEDESMDARYQDLLLRTGGPSEGYILEGIDRDLLVSNYPFSLYPKIGERGGEGEGGWTHFRGILR